MRVALFDIVADLGGPQRALADLACGLAARDWAVTTLLGAEGPLHAFLGRQGLEVVGLPAAVPARLSAGSLCGPAGWTAVGRLVRFCRTREIRLLIANSYPSAILGGVAMRLVGGQVLWHLHRVTDLPAQGGLLTLAGRLVSRIHTFTGLPPELLPFAAKCVVLAPGIERARITQGLVSAPPRGGVIGLFGAWRPSTGQEVLLQAFRLLRARGRWAHLRMAGTGERTTDLRFRAMLASAVKASGLGAHVQLEEPPDDLGAFIAACDFLVIPAHRASTGRLVLEAAALGKPVIATQVPVLTHLVRDGQTGLLIPPDDPRALADALTLLIASPSLREELGRKARLHVEEHHALHPILAAVERAAGGG
jgi:glycosyltransferase involved in cell wall biosynthesis